MAGGWSADGAAQQIDDTVADGEIPAARREAQPGLRWCVAWQTDRDRGPPLGFSLYNRRGCKDSQLR